MMTTQQLAMIWDHIRQMNGITMRLLETIPADQIDAHPISSMRSPKELMVHLYGYVRAIPEGIVSGEIRALDEPEALKAIRTRDDLVRFCTDCWKAGDRAIGQVTDTQLAATVQTPWGGATMPGAVCVQVIRDELTHHRGQLYCFARALGAKEVPMMWDFAGNAPEYRPGQPATA
jgi:uncharacterized damage-inducible protein DinB